jgi:hypothetical protein
VVLGLKYQRGLILFFGGFVVVELKCAGTEVGGQPEA